MNLDVEPAGSAHFINESLWIDAIHPEVLAQCDALDGVRDSVVAIVLFVEYTQ